MERHRRMYDPRWRRQEVLLAVLKEASDDEKVAALRELAMIGDADAAFVIREQALGGDKYRDRAFHEAFRQIVEREREGIASTVDGLPFSIAMLLDGNFAEMQISPPPLPGPDADHVTRVRVGALGMLAYGGVEDKLTALGALARVGDESAALAVCRELMSPEPRVQHAARLAYKQIIARVSEGECPAELGHGEIGSPEDQQQQLRHKALQMVKRDLEGTPRLPPAPERLPDVVAVVANALRGDDTAAEAGPAPAAVKVTEPVTEPVVKPVAEPTPLAPRAEADAAEVPPPSQATTEHGAPVIPSELPLAAPSVSEEEAALLPTDDDPGLLPQ